MTKHEVALKCSPCSAKRQKGEQNVLYRGGKNVIPTALSYYFWHADTSVHNPKRCLIPYDCKQTSSIYCIKEMSHFFLLFWYYGLVRIGKPKYPRSEWFQGPQKQIAAETRNWEQTLPSSPLWPEGHKGDKTSPGAWSIAIQGSTAESMRKSWGQLLLMAQLQPGRQIWAGWASPPQLPAPWIGGTGRTAGRRHCLLNSVTKCYI